MAMQTDVQIGDASFAVEVGAIYPHGAGPWGDVRLREIGGGRDVGGFIWPLTEPFLISLARSLILVLVVVWFIITCP